MKKILCAICICMFAVSSSHADIVTSLGLPADGNYAAGAFPTITTQATTPTGATFDISYTLSAVSNDTGPVVGVIGGAIGVGSDNDINPNHFNTLEGNGSAGANGSTAGGEGLSFTGLAISNFQANGSGLVLADITDLQFESLTYNAVGNNQDGVDTSFQGFGTNTANTNLAPVVNPYELDLETLANFDATATDLYIQPDNTAQSNRWSIIGVAVSFNSPDAVPEPSSLCVLGFGLIGLISRRRRA